VNRAAFIDDVGTVAIVAFDLEDLVCDEIVLVPGKVEATRKSAPGVEAPVDATAAPRSFVTNVGPTSRIHASSWDISTTRTCAGSWALANSKCPADAPTVTGSNRAMAVATFANACCAGNAPRRQLSGRSGHSIQQPAWGANSAGIEKPSASGVESRVFAMGQDCSGPGMEQSTLC
jgi:hypothetical protein